MSYKKFILFLSIIITLTFVSCTHKIPIKKQQILTINTINKANNILNQADKNTLVIFDIDLTLTMPSNTILLPENFNKYKDVTKRLLRAFNKDQIHILRHLILTQSPSRLVELNSSKIIKDLQKQGIKTIAMTASKTGTLGNKIINFPEWRYRELKKLGIDFSKSFSHNSFFKNLKIFHKSYPGIYKGIISTSGSKNSKGTVLQAFLNTVNYTPNHIIVIDDKMKNLISISNTLKKLNIIFTGLLYSGANKIIQTKTDKQMFTKTLSNLIKKNKSTLEEYS